jgi:2-polyprenyl-3-methyl-5-hydroxy-6-metoxy-1,4-benzoquinol methylase
MATLTEHIAEVEFLDNSKKVEEYLVKMLERKQRIEDHSGMIYNPFTKSWSFGFTM